MSNVETSNTKYWSGGKTAVFMSGVVTLGIAYEALEGDAVTAALGLGVFGLYLLIEALKIPSKIRPEP